MNEKQLKALQAAIIAELGTLQKKQKDEIVSDIVEKIKSGDIVIDGVDDIKEEVKKIKESLVEGKTNSMSMIKKQEAIVSIFKSIASEAKVSEEKAGEIIEKSIKTILGTASNSTETSVSKLVFDQFHKDILIYINEDDFLKELDVININKGDSYTFINASNGITTEYVDQASKGSASAPTFARVSVNVHKIYSQVNIAEESYDQMAVPDLYKLIVRLIAESQRNFIRKEILSGSTKMTGILKLSGANSVEIGAKLSEFTDDHLIDIQGSLPEDVIGSGEAVHIMSRYVLTQLRKLRDSKGARLYPELRGDNPTLDGERVIIAKEASEITNSDTDTTGKKAWIYGVLRNAKVVRRQDATYQKGYVNDGMLTGVETVVAKQRLGMKVINEKSFTIISTNG